MQVEVGQEELLAGVKKHLRLLRALRTRNNCFPVFV